MPEREALTFVRSEKNAEQDGCDQPDCAHCQYGHALRHCLGTLVEAAQDVARLRTLLSEMRAEAPPFSRTEVRGDRWDDLLDDSGLATVVAFTVLVRAATDSTPEGKAFALRELEAMGRVIDRLAAQDVGEALLEELRRAAAGLDGRSN